MVWGAANACVTWSVKAKEIHEHFEVAIARKLEASASE